MRSIFLSGDNNEPLNVLCLGAHCDDIEIGCGGALLELLRTCSAVNVYWQVYASTPARKSEAVQGAEQICAGAQSLEIDILDFRDGYLPYEGAAVKEAFEETKQKFDPDLIFTHYRSDLHQDHRKISELTWNTFRDHIIWEYEIPKWDGDLGSPNVFVELDQSVAEEKLSILQSVYNSQNDKKWFTNDFFSAILRLRGAECNSPSGLAEGFYARKNVVSFGT